MRSRSVPASSPRSSPLRGPAEDVHGAHGVALHGEGDGSGLGLRLLQQLLPEIPERGLDAGTLLLRKDNLQAAVDEGRKYYIKLSNGKEISIPDEGGVIGRTELGAEELAEYPSVSRQHIKVTVRRNIGVLIEDISKYGTFVDGQRISKNEPVRITNGSKITLCNVDAELLVKEVIEQ